MTKRVDRSGTSGNSPDSPKIEHSPAKKRRKTEAEEISALHRDEFASGSSSVGSTQSASPLAVPASRPAASVPRAPQRAPLPLARQLEIRMASPALYFLSIDQAIDACLNVQGLMGVPIIRAAASYIRKRLSQNDAPSLLANLRTRDAVHLTLCLFQSDSPPLARDTLGGHVGLAGELVYKVPAPTSSLNDITDVYAYPSASGSAFVSVEQRRVQVWQQRGEGWSSTQLSGHKGPESATCVVGTSVIVATLLGELVVATPNNGVWHYESLCGHTDEVVSLCAINGEQFAAWLHNDTCMIWTRVSGVWQHKTLGLEHDCTEYEMCALGEGFAISPTPKHLLFLSQKDGDWTKQHCDVEYGGLIHFCSWRGSLIGYCDSGTLLQWTKQEDGVWGATPIGSSAEYPISYLSAFGDGFIAIDENQDVFVWTMQDGTWRNTLYEMPPKSPALGNVIQLENGAFLSICNRDSVCISETMGSLAKAAQAWKTDSRVEAQVFDAAAVDPHHLLAQLDRGCGVEIRNDKRQCLAERALQLGHPQAAALHIVQGGVADTGTVTLALQSRAFPVLAALLERGVISVEQILPLTAQEWVLQMNACIDLGFEQAACLLLHANPCNFSSHPELLQTQAVQTMVLRAVSARFDELTLLLMANGAPALPTIDAANGKVDPKLRAAAAHYLHTLLAAEHSIAVVATCCSTLQHALLPWLLQNASKYPAIATLLRQTVNGRRLLPSIIEQAIARGETADNSSVVAVFYLAFHPLTFDLAQAVIQGGVLYLWDFDWESVQELYPNFTPSLAVLCGMHPVLQARYLTKPFEPTSQPTLLPVAPGKEVEWLRFLRPALVYAVTQLTVDPDRPSLLPAQMMRSDPTPWRRNLWINYVGQQGVDMDGLTKDWLGRLGADLISADAGIFETASHDSSLVSLQSDILAEAQGDSNSPRYRKLILSGYLFGRSLWQLYPLGISLPKFLLKHLVGQKPTLEDLQQWDPTVGSSLASLLTLSAAQLAAMDLTFTWSTVSRAASEPGGVSRSVDVPLIENGAMIPVTVDNRSSFIAQVVDFLLVRRIGSELCIFARGVFCNVPARLLSQLSPEQLHELIAGRLEVDCSDWQHHTLVERNEIPLSAAEHPPVVQWFWNFVQGLTIEQRRKLLWLVTSCQSTPAGGFATLDPPCKLMLTADTDRIPTSSTCFNSLYLPEYTSEAALQEKLLHFLNSEGDFSLS